MPNSRRDTDDDARAASAGARQHVIDPPANVTLPKVPPRRPPGEELVVVGVERAADIDQPGVEQPREQRALLRPRADLIRLAFLRMHVALFAGDVQIATDDCVRPLAIVSLAQSENAMKNRSLAS